jgi:uncharacterized protein (UPF0332 family)
MFYIAEAFLWQQGFTFSSHAAVISCFGKEVAKKGIVPLEFHRYLIDAQDKRTQGDYSTALCVTFRYKNIRQNYYIKLENRI